MMRRKGFTLVELVVVILILGILAGVAAPKMLNTSAKATDNGVKQTLGIIRDAIELQQAQNSGAPITTASSTAFVDALKPFMRGVFPKNPVHKGTPATAATVSFVTTATTPADDLTGWKYNSTTGEFICNTTGASASGIGAYEAF